MAIISYIVAIIMVALFIYVPYVQASTTIRQEFSLTYIPKWLTFIPAYYFVFVQNAFKSASKTTEITAITLTILQVAFFGLMQLHLGAFAVIAINAIYLLIGLIIFILSAIANYKVASALRYGTVTTIIAVLLPPLGLMIINASLRRRIRKAVEEILSKV